MDWTKDPKPKSSIRVNILGNLTRFLVKNFKDLRLYLLLCTQQAQFYRVDSQPEYFSYYLVILQILAAEKAPIGVNKQTFFCIFFAAKFSPFLN